MTHKHMPCKSFSADSCVRIFFLLSIQRSVSQAKAKAKEYGRGMDEDADEEIYEADCIVGVKWGRHKHGVEKGEKPEHIFKTRWKGCGESEDTWEPLTNLDGCKISENSLSFLILPDDAQAHALQIFFR